MTLSELNAAHEGTAREALLACCGSNYWVQEMLDRRPFASPEALLHQAESVWHSLSAADWLEAFASHPKIGERSSGKWSTEEQQGAAQGDPAMMEAIREMNSQYQRQFGYIFIVCATGKCAAEICSLLKERLGNEPATELQIAAAEQTKIMRLRLHKLLAE
jgi:2-oxo-4-hydroxy-4-carboxy-5-ureidoimidazoline decarboxylase